MQWPAFFVNGPCPALRARTGPANPANSLQFGARPHASADRQEPDQYDRGRPNDPLPFSADQQALFHLHCSAPALGLLAALFALLLAIAGLNVGISYVGRDFMTALARRQPHQVYMFALMYLGVFAASAAAGAFAKFFELLLGLRWREWLTEHFVRQYLSSQAYFRVNAHTEVDNPDERISEDLRTFTSTALSFLIMVTNSVITLVAFIGVLWSITPWLVVAGVLYPLLGTSAIVVIGRHLVHLNHLQLKKEADFRFELVHVRTHAESVALVQSERKAEAAPRAAARRTGHELPLDHHRAPKFAVRQGWIRLHGPAHSGAHRRAHVYARRGRIRRGHTGRDGLFAGFQRLLPNR